MFIIDILQNFISTNVFTGLIALALGIALLWISSEVVIRKITPIARFFRVKELLVTILGVSALSSLPEFMVSAFATAQGKPDISIGNIVGSNFVTLTFVSAVCALISPLVIRTEIKERESSWMILSSVSILLLAKDRLLSRIDGLILILLYIPYFFSVIMEALREAKDASKIEEKDKSEKKDKLHIVVIHIFIAALGIGGIILGADIALRGGETVGTKAGLSTLVLGILIFAFGTSLPELAIAMSATLKKKADISIGEIYASNIFTALFILGACSLISPMKVNASIINFDLPFLILAGVIIQIFITTGSKLRRLEALAIIAIYGIFIIGHFIKIPLFGE